MPTSTSLQRIAGSSFRHLRFGVKELKSNTFLRNVGVIGSGSAIGHIFTLAAGPFLTRMYGPHDFGVLGLFTTLVSVMGVAVTLQYEISIPVGRDEREAALLTFGSLLLAVPMSIFGGLVLWMLIYTASLGFGGFPWFTPFLLTFALLFVGLFTALRYWSLREERFSNIAHGVIVQSAGRALLQLVFGMTRFHPSGLLLGETAGRCLGMSNLLRNAWPKLLAHKKRFRWRDLAGALWHHRAFPFYSFPSSFLDALCLSLPLPLLIRAFGVSVGGYYSLVWKAVSVPSVLITMAVADTFHSRLATLSRDQPERVMGLFRATSTGLLFVGCVPSALLLIWGPQLFSWIFGARWAFSGTIAAVVVPWYFAQFVVSPLSRVVLVLNGQKMKLGWDVLCLTSLLVVFWIAHVRSLSALGTIRLLSGVYASLFVAYYLILLRVIVRFERTRLLAVEAV